MPTEIKMPKLSDTMTEGVLVSWKAKPGDAVGEGDFLGDVETDKATMEIENFAEGTVAALLVDEGATVAVGTPIALIAESGEDWQEVAKGASKSSGGSQKAEAKSAGGNGSSQTSSSNGSATAVAEAPDSPAATSPSMTAVEGLHAEQDSAGDAARTDSGRIKASPLAKKIAKERGVSLASITGSGPGGRIVRDDVLNAKPGEQPASAAGNGAAPQPAPGVAANRADADEEVPLTKLRQIIAQRLQQSKQTVPHFYVEMEIDAAPLAEFRAMLKDKVTDVKISVNDLILKACAKVLRDLPDVNAQWAGDKIIRKAAVDIGMGVAIDGGLLVPVIRGADQLSLSQIAKTARELATKARDRKLTPDEMTGSTFTVSNMGMYGITRFNAIVNPPEAAILAVGGIRKEPVVTGSGVGVGQRMSLTLSADHRVVDGANAAEFLVKLKQYLEEPVTLVV